MWLYRKFLMSRWEWLQRMTSFQDDGAYLRYKILGITVAKHRKRGFM